MARRLARRYSDGSFNVDNGEATDVENAKHRLGGSTDDDDTELVEVEIMVTASFGRPKLRIVEEDEANDRAEYERLRRKFEP